MTSTTTGLSHRRAHNGSTAAYLNELGSHTSFTDAITAQRAKNITRWVNHTHSAELPGVNPAQLNPSYLKDLYPNIWAYGPNGETYLTQLAIINTHLDNLGYANNDKAFLGAILDNLYNMEKVYEDFDFLSQLTDHAYETGMPLPGDLILGSTETSTEPSQAENLLNHYIWSYYPSLQKQFANFLYDFALITIHHTHLTNLHDDTVDTALNTYHMFCDTWGLPTP